MIERIKGKEVYNPIRDHIKIGFKIIKPADSSDKMNKRGAMQLAKITAIAEDLKEQGFDPEISRVLIFINSRSKTEEGVNLLSNQLEELSVSYCKKIDFYHAGLDGVQREEKYDDFQKGDTVILFATKAFGMGMDIKNIHYIYHAGPSTSFEDFLQEIGRAGRDKSYLTRAGFSEQKPIQTKCLLSEKDFKSMKDRNHKEQITISNIQNAFTILLKYIKTFSNFSGSKKPSFSIPFDLLNQSDEFTDIDKASSFRILLYWMERFKRIELGMYSASQLPIEIYKKNLRGLLSSDKENLKIKRMLVKANKHLKTFDPPLEKIHIDYSTLQQWLEVSYKDINTYLIKAQKEGFIKVHRKVDIVPTKLRSNELTCINDFSGVTLKGVFKFVRELMHMVKMGDQVQISGHEMDQIINESIQEYFSEEHITWKEKKKNGEELSQKEIAKKLYEDFKKKRSKIAFFLISNIPNVRSKTSFLTEKDGIGQTVFYIYNGCSERNEWIEYLENLEKGVLGFIKHISKIYYKDNEKYYNIIDLINSLKISNENEFQIFLQISKYLGYLKGGRGGISTMGIECSILDESEINAKDQMSDDYKIAEEFNESNSMKELRLMSLECLSELDSNHQDTFIKSYFSCSDQASLVLLLEEKFGEDHPYLQAFRAEALEQAEKDLNEEQRKIYDADLNSNLQVIAGPGSGKTHTLTLRVARLIQKEKISPEHILVLAYNRAVVIELKERLGKLFAKLGYGKLINRLKVFTFHGFIKFMITEELENKNFDEWTNIFLSFAKENPGVIAQTLGQINYVFVDEFQDITTERLELLKHIANPENVNICVIGDPNQSIYGYERAKVGDSLNSIPYYDKFKKLYIPETYDLVNNYRSYPNILKEAEELLSLNKTKFDMPALKPMIIPENKINRYSERIIYSNQNKVIWQDRLLQILKEGNNYNANKLDQVAVMFRSNAEVFRAFNILKSNEFSNYRIRVQGSASAPIRSREFHYLIGLIAKKENEIVLSSFKVEIKEYCDELKEKSKNWDNYLIDLFQSLVLEFMDTSDEDSRFTDLEEFIKDISDKEDGHLNKIYKSRLKEFSEIESRQEIVLTTMHKVKGLEFDAVLIPPSFVNLPQQNEEDVNEELLIELIEEERRLYYVAYTRAKYHLSIIEWNREEAMRNNKAYIFPENIQNRLGKVFKDGIDKFNISWGAKKYSEQKLEVFNIINARVSIGDEITIRKRSQGQYMFFEVLHNKTSRIVGQIRNNTFNNFGNFTTITGFRVSSVEVYTFEETERYDAKHGTTYAKTWSEISKKRGYIYLLDFSGYGLIV